MFTENKNRTSVFENKREISVLDEVDDKIHRLITGIQVKPRVLLLMLSHVLVFALGFMSQFQINLRRELVGTTIVEKCETSQKDGNGWHSVEVFYGKIEYFEQRIEQLEWYSQVNQDIIVSRLLGEKTNGYFIDLASNDATWISNTYALEKKFNWTGLCMEPNPAYWYDLAHRDCQVVGAVVGEIRNDAVVFQKSFHGAMGGIVGEEFDNHDENGGEVRYTVPLLEILTRFNAPKIIDYLSLDVEGAESLIMKHFPFDTYSFNIMTVERPKDDLRALFAEYGYEYIGTVGGFGETIWARTAIKDSLNIGSIDEFLVK
jgi:Methyltransferase FkbM domain